jgi:uncharacterized protein (DUF2267 family)
MDELVKQIAAQTGISEDMARKAVNVVVDYLKDKLPDSIAGQLDALLNGADLSQADDLLEAGKDLLGGLLGK